MAKTSWLGTLYGGIFRENHYEDSLRHSCSVRALSSTTGMTFLTFMLMFYVIAKFTMALLLKPFQRNEEKGKSFIQNKPSANVLPLDINSLKNNKRQQLIAQAWLVKNTGKLTCKSSYFSYKEMDNWKVLCVAVWETDKTAITDN